MRLDMEKWPEEAAGGTEDDWLAAVLAELVEIGVHADEAGKYPKRAIAQAVRGRFPDWPDEGRERMRELAYAELEEIQKETSRPVWAQSSAFDAMRRERKRRRAAALEAFERMAAEDPPAARSVQPQATRPTALAQEPRGRVMSPLKVVVTGEWGEITMNVEPDREGRVRVEGQLPEADALKVLSELSRRDETTVRTNRLER